MTALEIDPFDVARARHAQGLLDGFNAAGVLAAADVHVARRLASIGREPDEWVALAAALAVRGPRIGHVLVDLETVRQTAAVESEEPVDLEALPWPDPREWRERLAGSPLVALGEEGGEGRPLRLLGSQLYLDRYWREERRLAADLRGLAASTPQVRGATLADGLSRLFDDDSQRRAAAAALNRRFAVVAGGPGTGKTTTVAKILALLHEQGGPEPLVALAAPTARAAARLREAVQGEAERLDVDATVRERLRRVESSTLHGLLGGRPGSGRYRFHRGNRLPHDAVVVDESSMVPLTMMGRLVGAVRPDARLVLVGDPDQLRSIEAGAVLGDIVDPRAEGVVVLQGKYRFGEGIARLADAVRDGDRDAVVDVLRAAPEGVEWIPVDAGEDDSLPALQPVREGITAAGRAVLAAARRGQVPGALAALSGFRVLCAHRRGPYGVSRWTQRIEGWIASVEEGFAADGPWYVGRPLLVTRNDYSLRLYNGDVGVVVEGPRAAFEGEVEVSPARLEAVDTVYAMTIHKAQGSQFDAAVVLLPGPDSPILTRELLYTAVTRARRRLVLVGTEESIAAAVARRVPRASGLRERLWGGA